MKEIYIHLSTLNKVPLHHLSNEQLCGQRVVLFVEPSKNIRVLWMRRNLWGFTHFLSAAPTTGRQGTPDTSSDHSYTYPSAALSIEAALNDGKRVYLFENDRELCAWWVKQLEAT